MKNSSGIAIALLGALFFVASGSVANYSSSWYRHLRKPEWVTFERYIPLIWMLIYVATTASAILSWRSVRDLKARTTIFSLLGVNAVLNLLFTPIFTRRRDLVGAFVDASAIVATIAGVMASQWRVARGAALLNLPYLLWSTIAACITWSIYRQNAEQQSA